MYVRVILRDNFEIIEDCNTLEVKPEDVGYVTNLDMEMFGSYVISSEKHNNREQYMSVNGFYEIWFDDTDDTWVLSGKIEHTNRNDSIYLDLNSRQNYFDNSFNFSWNANGTETWTIHDQKQSPIDVNVRCSSRSGKIVKIFSIRKLLDGRNLNWPISCIYALKGQT